MKARIEKSRHGHKRQPVPPPKSLAPLPLKSYQTQPQKNAPSQNFVGKPMPNPPAMLIPPPTDMATILSNPQEYKGDPVEFCEEYSKMYNIPIVWTKLSPNHRTCPLDRSGSMGIYSIELKLGPILKFGQAKKRSDAKKIAAREMMAYLSQDSRYLTNFAQSMWLF